LSKYLVNFKPLKEFSTKNSKKHKALIIYKEDKDENIDFNSISTDTLIITNKDFKSKINNNKIKLINKITSPQNIIEEIEKYLFIKKFVHKNILIIDKKLKNVLNDKSCYLTDIERNILECIFLNNVFSRKYIKQNILNIKSSMETNSLDSHLTRIRKKFNQINADLIIESKNDIIKIS
tara:strand:- start:293 stop:829 length:537 start_codon:yes stop_codon:yes gene_type:complete